MIKLQRYVYPQIGARASKEAVWVNPSHIAMLTLTKKPAERFPEGNYTGEFYNVTTIVLAVSDTDGVCTTEVYETPEEIIELIHVIEDF